MRQSPQAMDELLFRTAAEIGRCRSMVITLEDAVHSLVETGVPGTGGPRADGIRNGGTGIASELIRDLQVLDLLDQHLQDLCLWTEALAEASRGCTISRDLASLMSMLRLDDLRRSLGGDTLRLASPAERTEVF